MAMQASDSQASWIYTKFEFSVHYLSFFSFWKNKRRSVMEKKQKFGAKNTPVIIMGNK